MKLVVHWVGDNVVEEFDQLVSINVVYNTCLHAKFKCDPKDMIIPLYNIKYYYIEKDDE